jgi:hypothetical protein
MDSNLRLGHSLSCGCLRSEKSAETGRRGATHGQTNSLTYRTWHSMKMRCSHPGLYPDHAGRGIRVCSRWKESFEVFFQDMGERPSRRHSIGRIDNNGNYEPGNCRWELPIQQMQNRRNTISLTVGAETENLAEWSRRSGVPETTLRRRVKDGWSHERAIFQPISPKGFHRTRGHAKTEHCELQAHP